jgi:hypothetical protein
MEDEHKVKATSVKFHYGPEAPAYWIDHFNNTHYENSPSDTDTTNTDQTNQNPTERVQL